MGHSRTIDPNPPGSHWEEPPRIGLELPPVHLDSCEIRAWKGYRYFELYAVSLDDGIVLAQSKGFRRRRASVPPDTPAARACHEQLLAELQAAGWQRQQHDGPWFATVLARPGRAPVVPTVPAQPAPAVAPASAPPPQLGSWSRPPAEAPAPVVVLPQPAEPEPEPEPEREPEPEPEPPAAAEQPDPEIWFDELETPAPAAAAEPMPVAPTAEPGAPVDRRARLARVISLCALPFAIGLGVWLTMGGPSRVDESPAPQVPQQQPAAAAPAPTAQQPAGSTAKPKPSAPAVAPPAVRRLARARLTGTGTGSWVEVRRGSRSGRVLYAGQLAPGQTIHFAARRLWFRLGSAGNVVVTVNGREHRLVGTVSRAVTAAGLRTR